MPRWFHVSFIAGLMLWGLMCLRHSYHPSDDGYILALAWRVFHGELPYRDFIYVRPPLSPWLHSLWFYLPQPFTWARLSFFLWYGVMYLALALGVVPRLTADTVERRWLQIVLAAGIVYSLHNFPPMPWHTLDGLLFGTVSLALAANGWWVFAGVAAMLSAACKQNFALIPFALVACTLLFERSRHSVLRVLFGQFAALALIALVIWPARSEFLELISSASKTGTLGSALIEAFRPRHAVDIVIWIGLGVLVLRRPRAGALGLLLTQTVFYRHFGGFLAAGPLWVIAALTALKHRHSGFLVVQLLVLALAATVSWGYASPILAGYAIVLVLGFTLLRLGLRPSLKEASAVLMVFALSTMAHQILIPYRDAPWPQQSASLGALFTRLPAPLYTDAKNATLLSDLATLSLRLDSRGLSEQVVMPHVPLFYFLTERRNPLALDWWLAVEHPGQEERLRAQMIQRAPTFLIIDQEPGSPLIDWVRANGQLIDEQGRVKAYRLLAARLRTASL